MAVFRKLSGTFSNPAGPPLVDWDQLFGADARVVQWWDFHPSRVTLSGGTMSRVAPRKPGGTALVQAIAAKQPNFITSTAALNGRPSLDFDQLSSVDVLVAEDNTIYPVATDSTFVAILNPSVVASTTFIAGGGATATGLHLITNAISASVGQLGQRVGTAGAQAAASSPAAKDTWHFGAWTYEKTAGQAAVSLNGLPFILGTANPSAVISDPTFALGAPASGSGTSATKWGFAMLLNVSLRTGNDDLLNHLKQYARDVFRLTVQ